MAAFAPGTSSGRGSSGFTLIETMMALLILVLLTGIVATGIPVAFDTYNKAVSASNAQVVLSTTITSLRNELGLARSVPTDSSGEFVHDSDGNLIYETGEGYYATIISPGTDDVVAVPVKQVYVKNVGGAFVPVSTDGRAKLIPEEMVKGTTQADGHSGGANNLRVLFDSITYDSDTQVFTVHGLRVVVDGEDAPVATAGDEFSIRAAVVED